MLPFEILVAIFQFCDPEVNARLAITHTCRLWRFTAAESAALWVRVEFNLKKTHSDQNRANHLSLIDTQLDRAGTLLLDVKWLGDAASYCDAEPLSLIREKAPFSRWRSLAVDLESWEPAEDQLFQPNDIFTNLTSFSILSQAPNNVYKWISQRTTSRLGVFNAGRGRSIAEALQVFPDAMRHISSLVLHVENTCQTPPLLSSKITKLRASARRSHPFPHIITYELDICLFKVPYNVDLRNLTTFIVNSLINILTGCIVTLPALRHLSRATLRLSQGAKLETPVLETLTIRPGESEPATRISEENNILRHPGYIHSPKKSLFIEIPFPEATMILILEASPHIESAKLTFDNKRCAACVMGALARDDDETISGTQIQQRPLVCPRLSELRMNFTWNVDDTRPWKVFARRKVESRRKAGVYLSIFASWKGEGTYVALA